MIVSLMPRNEKLIVYGGAVDRFIDNAKHLYIYNSNNPRLSAFKQIWLTRSSSTYNQIKTIGLPVVRTNSIKGYWLMLRAGFVVYDYRPEEFASFELTEGAVRINMWHGIPAKTWGKARSANCQYYKPNKSTFKERFMVDHFYGDYCVSTSAFLDRQNSLNASVRKENIIHATYPRIRVLLMSNIERVRYIERYEDDDIRCLLSELESCKEIPVIYMPTFRDSNQTYIDEAIPDWNDLDLFCKENNIMFFVKVHRVTAMPDVSNFTNIKQIDSQIDIYPLLPSFRLLITDYSSIMFDYAVLNKPIILYTYDLDDYNSKSRPLFPHFLELRKNITHVDDYNSLKSILAEPTSIVPFPVDNYYEWPANIESINDVFFK